MSVFQVRRLFSPGHVSVDSLTGPDGILCLGWKLCSAGLTAPALPMRSAPARPLISSHPLYFGVFQIKILFSLAIGSRAFCTVTLGWFAAECEAAGMRISTSKSKAMVISRKKVAYPLQIGGEFLPQVKEFKYLGVLFTSEGRMVREIDRRIGVASAVMRSIYRSLMTKKELSCKAKLSIYRSVYVPTLTYGYELWIMTERTRSRIQAAEMSFPHRVAERSLRDRVKSSISISRRSRRKCLGRGKSWHLCLDCIFRFRRCVVQST